jgi:CRISPR/Cas system CSM-associated protein Csm3 (group 7 of RAMP superfamily)
MSTATLGRREQVDPIVVGRVVAVTTLRLVTATHFGGGESERSDAQVLRDGDGLPFIPGASLAGAARAFLRSRRVEGRLLELLFGGHEPSVLPGGAATAGRESDWWTSLLIVDDAFPTGPRPAPVLRDSVRIDGKRGSAADQGKFDYEVLEPGTRFSLRLELILRRGLASQHVELRALVNALLDAFQFGEIRLGAHTRRGLGRVETDRWRVLDLDFREPQAVLRWLQDAVPGDDADERCAGARPGSAIPAPVTPYLHVSATLALGGPILVRAAPSGDMADPADRQFLLHAPDAVQFRSGGAPVVPGSSLAGVLRHRAERICRTLGADTARVDAVIDDMFGPGFRDNQPPEDHRASRLRVDEAPIVGSRAERQTRIKIDRLSGSPIGGALLEEMPAWPNEEAPATLSVSLRLEAPAGADPARANAERGLLLLLLKDLCTGDLPVGGGAAVGRGILRGIHGRIEWMAREGDQRQRWNWQADGQGSLTTDSDAGPLEEWVDALNSYLEGGAA